MTSRILSPALGRRVLFGAMCAVLFILFLRELVAYDLWWHLKAGENIVRTGIVPRTDPFSYTAEGWAWTYHSWLAGVILYGAHAIGGLAGLVLLKAALITAALLLAWLAARGRGVGAGLASVLCLAAAYQLRTVALARPHLFSFVLSMVFYLVLQHASAETAPGRRPDERSARERDFLWGPGGRLLALPALMIAWANLHGGFMVGLLLIGAFGGGELIAVAARARRGSFARALLMGAEGCRFRALLVTWLLCLLGSFITPYGPGAFLYTFRFMAEIKLAPHISEWKAMPLSADYVTFWGLLVLAGVALPRSLLLCRAAGWWRERAGQFGTDGLLMAGFGLMAVTSVRNLAWFVLLVPPVLGHHLALARSAAGRARPEAQAARAPDLPYVCAFCALAAVLLVRHLSGGGFGFGVSAERLPVRACDYLEGAPLKGRIYNAYEWGGYLIWRFWPRRQVFIDGRCLVYGDSGIRQAMDVASGRGNWKAILRQHHVAMILIPYRERDSTHFFRDGDWHCVHWDDTALLAVSDAVRRGHPPGVEFFDLSNPVMFDERLEDSPPAAILEELDLVLAREPRCWTALAFRARCLVRLAQQDEQARDTHLAAALDAARRAVAINRQGADAWRALAECYEALGRPDQAAHALAKAQSLSRRKE